MKDVICADCGGFDLEWMRRCAKHGAEYCRGCSCPICEDEDFDEYEEDGPQDLEDVLEKALDKALPLLGAEK
jgi:hypothetical protein